MPLYVLLILVIGGISLVALLLHWLGKSGLTVLDNNTARAAWLRHFPEDKVQAVVTAENGHTALIDTENGPGLLWSFGADTVARYLTDYQLREAQDHLTIAFTDFSAPRVTVNLSAAERPHWQQKLAHS